MTIFVILPCKAHICSTRVSLIHDDLADLLPPKKNLKYVLVETSLGWWFGKPESQSLTYVDSLKGFGQVTKFFKSVSSCVLIAGWSRSLRSILSLTLWEEFKLALPIFINQVCSLFSFCTLLSVSLYTCSFLSLLLLLCLPFIPLSSFSLFTAHP